MKILLTGRTGFLGQNIYNNLKNKYDIYGFGSKEFDLRKQDMCESLLKMIKPNIIIHAAGSVGGIYANQQNPGKFMYDNLIMGTNIIHQCMLQKIDKIILLGTVCAYPKYTPIPFKEEDLWNGYPEETNAPYGIAKKTLMKLLEVYNKQYNINGINLIPANMYGPHDYFNTTTSHIIPALILKIYNAIQNNIQVVNIWGTGQASREFLYVQDCVNAIDKAIEINTSFNTINIGTGIETKIIDLVNIIAKSMNFKGEFRYDKNKPDGQPRRCLDVSKAKDILQFKAQTALEDGLEQTINWFKKKIIKNKG